MRKIMIMEPDTGVIAKKIRGSLARRDANDISVFDTHTPEKAPGAYDILVISSDSLDGGILENVPHCGTILLPMGHAAPVAAKSVVTYGMSPKSTLTLSSIGEESCVIALLREIVTASGGVLDRQELKIKAHCCADELLAVSGTLLLLGYLPDEI